MEIVLDLYPYQQEGVEFLASKRRAYLADEMGLGKSAQAVVAAREINATNTTIVCPASTVENWKHEWEKWEGQGELEIISYASLIRDRGGRNPDLVICDEAHYCKTPSAQRTRAALGLARKTVRNGGRAWLLSGTPVPNDPTELWPPIKYLWSEIAQEHDCQTKREWMYQFTKVRITPYGFKPYAVKNGAALRKSLDKIMLRRTLDDVALELPPLRIDLQRLPKSQAAEEKLAEYEEWEETDYTSTIRRLLGSLKAPIIVRQLAEELMNKAYEKLVIFYHHKDVGAQVVKMLKSTGVGMAGFGGDASSKERERQIQRFQNVKDVRVFVGQQTAAGIGVNLTAANEVVLLEPAWTPSDNEQALKRIHRIGQEKPCRVRIFCLSGTIDEAIMGTIRNKVKMQKEVGL